jgi:ppGpp synthetase/RelA/SpoT-type nucleotidyltranferase
MEDRIAEKAEKEGFNITTNNQNRTVEDLKIIIKDLGVRVTKSLSRTQA